METPKPFRLLDNAEFQRLSTSEKIVYLTKAIDAVRKESRVVEDSPAETDAYAKTLPLGTNKRR